MHLQMFGSVMYSLEQSETQWQPVTKVLDQSYLYGLAGLNLNYGWISVTLDSGIIRGYMSTDLSKAWAGSIGEIFRDEDVVDKGYGCKKMLITPDDRYLAASYYKNDTSKLHLAVYKIGDANNKYSQVKCLPIDDLVLGTGDTLGDMSVNFTNGFLYY